MVKTKFMFTVQVKDKTYSVILGQNLKNQAIVDIRTIWLFTDWTVRNVASINIYLKSDSLVSSLKWWRGSVVGGSVVLADSSSMQTR